MNLQVLVKCINHWNLIVPIDTVDSIARHFLNLKNILILLKSDLLNFWRMQLSSQNFLDLSLQFEQAFFYLDEFLLFLDFRLGGYS